MTPHTSPTSASVDEPSAAAARRVLRLDASGEVANEAHQTFLATVRFGSLDGLRCASILAVIFHHAVGDRSRSHWYSGAGATGVWLFFAISGFLITTLLLRERTRRGKISLPAFYARRSLRIFPLYYTVLVVYIVAVLALDRNTAAGQEFWGNLPYYATYTSDWFVALDAPRVIFYFAWSLAAEEQFYLLWPLLLTKLPTRALAVVLFCALVVPAVMLSIVQDGSLSADLLPVRVILSIQPAIIMGVIAALLLHHRRSFAVLWVALGGRPASLVLAGVVLALLVYQANQLLVISAMAALVVSCVIREDHWLRRSCSLRPVRSIGAVSYGIYMMHVLVLNLVDRAGSGLGFDQPLVSFVATVGLAWGVALLSFRYYESWFLRRKLRFAR